jgi:uncharacterized protein YeaO (DUF488 family)
MLAAACVKHVFDKAADMKIDLARVYDVTTSTEGYRVLVDRIWPRGLSKGTLAIDEWCNELAPSSNLWKWFSHDPARWDEFRSRYLLEMQSKADTLGHLRELVRKQKLLLLYSARDQNHNQAVVIREALISKG